MRTFAKLTASSLPLVVTLGGWKLAVVVNAILGCESIGKDPEPCVVSGVHIHPLLDGIAWYGMLLWMPALVVSCLWAGRIIAPNVPRPWGSKSAE
jgi:hypothetical protein